MKLKIVRWQLTPQTDILKETRLISFFSKPIKVVFVVVIVVVFVAVVIVGPRNLTLRDCTHIT